MATAYAAVLDGVINIRSVSPTPVGAMVNWLWTDGGVKTGNAKDDQWVVHTFMKLRGEVKINEVSIEIKGTFI